MNSKPIQSAVLAVATTFALVAGAVSPAVAAVSDPAKPKQEQTASKAESRKYCIYTEATGSRIPKKECRTLTEWRDDGIDPLELLKQAR